MDVDVAQRKRRSIWGRGLKERGVTDLTMAAAVQS
jgi:hypothetical protein